MWRLNSGNTPNYTKSCQWVYRTSGHSKRKIVIYEYTQTKEAEHPKKFLVNFSGLLHVDGDKAYRKLPQPPVDDKGRPLLLGRAAKPPTTDILLDASPNSSLDSRGIILPSL